MRIGIVCHPSIGGSGLIATQLGIGLARKGHDIHFICRERPFKLDKLEPNIHLHLVEEINYPLFEHPLYTFALTAKIVEVAQKHQLDVVHAHYSIPHSLCCYLAEEISQYKFATITTIHGTDVTVVGQDRPLYPLNEFSINKSTKVTTVSKFQRSYIHANFNITNHIDVINNFIDMDVFTPHKKSSAVRQTLAEPDEKILMHISNFREVKNTKAVIAAFHLVQSKIKSRLVLLGNGPDIDAMKEMATDLGIIDKINFMGNINHVESLLPNADCVIQPSYHESFSMVVLEAMASAIPTVSSNVDGIPEVAKHGETGYLADPDDVVSMAGFVIDIMSNDKLQYLMGQNGRARAMQKFSWDAKVEQYLSCYQAALLEHRKSILTLEKDKQSL
ncbi:N-acetyl-alpha-D-glucosaminyl L-malate synthase BshA [Thalassotalea sp. Y01]|uniref:N-acetyl-alpha-D-glucosaminyl L-malate synthase BshA n=1 Tax=Thalassotalea sp. Y01 TaxID=2729613 RepID=UPI00145D6270|nr:N-acetyl-alpha-D-glucosaminyl L-malate synthase BshA [Thalassotalea sp. Y01]NMP15670.1 N-acetyl-alpha-D-glucosaminyl L-malate synthase BshA [Thalassotalea sp. Y01]